MAQPRTQRNTADAEASSPERLLRIDDVAHRLSISRSMAWKLVSLGSLRSVRIGRSVRVRPSELEAYLADAERQV